jgi:hypothetical protein
MRTDDDSTPIPLAAHRRRSSTGDLRVAAARMMSRCAQKLRSRNRQILVVSGACTNAFGRTTPSCAIFVKRADALGFSADVRGAVMASSPRPTPPQHAASE